MRVVNAIFALPFIAAVIGFPVPALERRASAPSRSNPLDLVSVLNDLKTKIVSLIEMTECIHVHQTDWQQPTIDLLKSGGGLMPTSTAEGYVTTLKESFVDLENLIGGLSLDEVTGRPEDMCVSSMISPDLTDSPVPANSTPWSRRWNLPSRISPQA